MNRAFRFGRAAAIVLMVLSVTASRAGAQKAPLRIEAILAATGQAAYSGRALTLMLSALEKYTNANGGVRGQPNHFDVYDDQTSPQVTLQLANATFARRVPVILRSAVVATVTLHLADRASRR